MDAEVVAGIMNDLWALVDRAITDHGGRIDKHIGDAVMALWGAETAREDDPEMAVRGALAMQAAIDEFCTTHSVPLAMRVGVNTGPVLLGQVGTTGRVHGHGRRGQPGQPAGARRPGRWGAHQPRHLPPHPRRVRRHGGNP
jgi:class 3 adenylate cyclase